MASLLSPDDPEIRCAISLLVAHSQKVYFSGRLLRRIESPIGTIPRDDVDWIWAQLVGTQLSLWNMKEVDPARGEGREVPSSYFNIQDASISTSGASQPRMKPSPQRYPHVITLDAIGTNQVDFSCSDVTSLSSWTAALRLARWEKLRLEEMYTGHMIRAMNNDDGVWKEPSSPLFNGRMEGWARIRMASQSEPQRVWVVLQSITQDKVPPFPDPAKPVESGARVTKVLNRIRSLFTLVGTKISDKHEVDQTLRDVKSSLTFYSSQESQKTGLLMRLVDITHAYAVSSQHREQISRSTSLRVVGTQVDRDSAPDYEEAKESWVLIEPEVDDTDEDIAFRTPNVLGWAIALHDAFGLYGRPGGYKWDIQDPESMMFAYPKEDRISLLFLGHSDLLPDTLDPKEDRISAVHSCLTNRLEERLHEQRFSEHHLRTHGMTLTKRWRSKLSLAHLSVMSSSSVERLSRTSSLAINQAGWHTTLSKASDTRDAPPIIPSKRVPSRQEGPMLLALSPSDADLVELLSDIPIAQGGFCDLFIGFHGPTQLKIAMKRPRLISNATEPILRRFHREAKMWSAFSHPNILPFLGSVEKNHQLYLVSPWLHLGDLLKVVQGRQEYMETPGPEDSPNTLSRIYLNFREGKTVQDVAAGMSYLHSHGVVHGDLKARNVLVSDGGRAQICDFGLTKMLDHAITSTELKGVGSLRWQGPELLDNEPKTMKSDVYAFAMTVVEILTAKLPFPHLKEQAAVVRAIVLTDERPPFDPLSQWGVDYRPLWDIAAKCWRKAPSERLTMVEVLQELERLEIASNLQIP